MVKLTRYRFLDMALVCELKGDIKMALVTASKAVQVKKDCQGTDFPEYAKYAAVLERLNSKWQFAQRKA